MSGKAKAWKSAGTGLFMKWVAAGLAALTKVCGFPDMRGISLRRGMIWPEMS